MCNIAGYIGKKQAAPILCGMMKRQEGFNGGYYTGIVTHDGEKLCSDKVIGDMKNLLAETDCLNFKGTTGFLHSRSKSGGGYEWGHPFLSKEKDLAYIANGHAGVFLDDALKEKRSKIADELELKGYEFKSKVADVIGDYPILSDETAIHMSDLMCQYIKYFIDCGKSPVEAMSLAHSGLPCEVVGLAMTKDSPDKIFVTRHNFPMMIGITDDGDTYLATTALAFPEDEKFKIIEALPAGASYEVFYGGYKMTTENVTVKNIEAITPDMWQAAYKIIEEAITNEALTVGACKGKCASLWQSGKVQQGDMLVYEVLRAFKKEGRLEIKFSPDSGAFEGYETNIFKVKLK